MYIYKEVGSRIDMDRRMRGLSNEIVIRWIAKRREAGTIATE
jgi:hypothetical protein